MNKESSQNNTLIETLPLSNERCNLPVFEYEYIEDESGLNNAFDILFQEVVKYRAI